MGRHSVIHAGSKGYLMSMDVGEGGTPTFTSKAVDAKPYPYCEVWHEAKEMNKDMDLLESCYGCETVEEWVFTYESHRR
jgi:hypothetical protein